MINCYTEMSVLSIIILIVFGILLLLVEFLIIPGITVAGIAGFLFVCGGIFLGYYYHEPATGNYILIGTVGFMAISFTLALKSKTWQHFGLDATIEGKVGKTVDDVIKAGDIGVTISKLSPIGRAMINNKQTEVRSEGKYIDQNCEIYVSRIEGNRIYVETKN